MKWTRQRCQLAPSSTVSIAPVSPAWASLMTSWVPRRPRALERAQERRPERAVLAVADGEAEDLPVAVGGHAGSDHHGLGHHAALDPGLAVGGVEEHVGEGLAGEAAVAERGDLDVEIGADPRHLALADTGVGAERFHQVIDLARADPVQIGLHHHREQRLVDASSAFQQGGKEAAGAQLGQPQLQVPGRRGQRPRSGPVALSGAGVSALVRAGADERGQLRVDQRLVERLDRRADPLIDIGDLQCLEELEQGRLIQGHRVAFL